VIAIEDMMYGWMPDLPSYHSDYTDESEEVKDLLGGVLVKGDLPSSVNLSKWCSPIKNQGKTSSCTAHAGTSMMEYFQIKNYNKYINGSRLFLYYTSRKMAHIKTDRGAYIRSTMGAMAMFGICEEEYWRFDVRNIDVEPSGFEYGYAEQFQALKYYRLDGRNTNRNDLLKKIKTHLASELPIMFGFTVFSSIATAYRTGNVQLPNRKDRVTGGHAVMACGFDDNRIIKNLDGTTSRGAIKFRNSWGQQWGSSGEGWLSYDYILKGLTSDWWTMLDAEWVDTSKFKR